MPTNFLVPLESGRYYHIYNRGNDGCNIFYKNENYRYFLSKYDSYLSSYFDTFAYCLLPNHFHFMIRVKDQQDFPSIKENEKFSKSLRLGKSILENLENKIVSEQCRKFFLAYSKAINKQETRTGSLFQKYFRRKEITSDKYFASLIFYIHNNPVHHGFTNDLRLYQWSSYKAIVNEQPTKIQKNELLKWFGGKNDFTDFHKNLSSKIDISDFVIEE